MKGKIREVTHYTTGNGCNKTSYISLQTNSNKLKHTLQVILCSNWMCTVLIAALTTCPSSKDSTGLDTKETPGQHRGAD